MNEKDKELALEIARAWFDGRCPEIEGAVLASAHSNPTYVLSSYIEYAMDQARKDAREAAFRDAHALVRQVRSSSLWNANGYDGALTSLLDELRESAAATEETDLYTSLRRLLDSYTKPCVGDCNHSQCPLLRELHALRIKASLERARQTVKPIVDRERTGEEIGDLMNMRLD